MKRYNQFLFLISLLLCFGLSSCVDEELNPEAWDKELPEELKEGYSIRFRMSLDPMGGGEFRTRASSDLKDMEDFVDLEKVRVLFFTCQYENDGVEDQYTENGKTYDSGLRDYFLFESSSRWVSEMTSTSLNASKLWQITTPIFPYGNQDLEYNWEKIREALTTKPFKIVILANRPPRQRFADFDGTLAGSQDNFYFDNQGPYWDETYSWANNVDADNKIKEGAFVPTINELHHCQWDPVYTSKNWINNTNGSSVNGNNIYDLIMKNPDQDEKTEKNSDGIAVNQMGAVSQWARQMEGKDKPYKFTFTDRNKQGTSKNYAVHPNMNIEDIGGIPMYGVQRFEPLTNWAMGTPFNVSENQMGQDNSYYGKTISLLRSVARLDLLIPKSFSSGGEKYDIELEDVMLCYSNIMARVVPLDVATPTDVLWSNDNCEGGECEWFDLQAHGPIINGNLGQVGYGEIKPDTEALSNLKDLRRTLMGRLAWYYGAWRKWWHFNETVDYSEVGNEISATGVSPTDDSFFGNGPYPHIFNPCVQRNTVVWLDGTDSETNVIVDDPSFYHYVVYTGERYINDPSNFRNLDIINSKVAYFQFKLKVEERNIEKYYQIALTDYSKNEIVKDFLTSYDMSSNYSQDMENGTNSYRTRMASQTDQKNWNWILLRNHIYRFQVVSFGDLKDDGTDGLVISTEERKSPDILYN
ncbi:MAG: hypothetical protein J1E16_06725 [Muribaculaceae bacterium]|nr:hypothetical protein [Muribaculaceae bacterium]